MITIDWKEFKLYKKESTAEGLDNLEYLIRFVRSFYNLRNSGDMYDTFCLDTLATQLMQKHEIDSSAKLELYLINKKIL